MDLCFISCMDLACYLWWTMLMYATSIYLCSSCGCEAMVIKLKFMSYILCILYALISTCRENSVKMLIYKYVCSGYSFKFICTHQGGVLSTHWTWLTYSYIFWNFQGKWVSFSKVQFQVLFMPSVWSWLEHFYHSKT
jgi:hypothetical protein